MKIVVRNFALSSMLLLTTFVISLSFHQFAADANGFGESRGWQFRTNIDRANMTAVSDLIEKKKGGYYDGFETVVYSTNNTNIGSQINCNTLADAKANIADNGQSGSVIDIRSEPSVTADSVGNTASNANDGDAGAPSSEQDNSGNVLATVADSAVSSKTGSIKTSATYNELINEQQNSGNQTATVQGSTTCDMTGSSLNGSVDIQTGDISTNGSPLNMESP